MIPISKCQNSPHSNQGNVTTSTGSMNPPKRPDYLPGKQIDLSGLTASSLDSGYRSGTVSSTGINISSSPLRAISTNTSLSDELKDHLTPVSKNVSRFIQNNITPPSATNNQASPRKSPRKRRSDCLDDLENMPSPIVAAPSKRSGFQRHTSDGNIHSTPISQVTQHCLTRYFGRSSNQFDNKNVGTSRPQSNSLRRTQSFSPSKLKSQNVKSSFISDLKPVSEDGEIPAKRYRVSPEKLDSAKKTLFLRQNAVDNISPKKEKTDVQSPLKRRITDGKPIIRKVLCRPPVQKFPKPETRLNGHSDGKSGSLALYGFDKCSAYSRESLLPELLPKYKIENKGRAIQPRRLESYPKHFDIINALMSKNLNQIVNQIIGHLSDIDLYRFANVSTQWRSVLKYNDLAETKRLKFVKRKRESKENMMAGKMEAKRPVRLQSQKSFGERSMNVMTTSHSRENQRTKLDEHIKMVCHLDKREMCTYCPFCHGASIVKKPGSVNIFEKVPKKVKSLDDADKRPYLDKLLESRMELIGSYLSKGISVCICLRVDCGSIFCLDCEKQLTSNHKCKSIDEIVFELRTKPKRILSKEQKHAESKRRLKRL